MILQNGKRIDGCSDTVPVGTLQPYLGLVPPKGYLVCQGQLVSKITYSKLYEICGDVFGISTETHFYLPDLRGKTLAGYDENDAAMNTIGKLLGQKTHVHTTGNHTLTVAEMPEHNHLVWANLQSTRLNGSPAWNTVVTANDEGTGITGGNIGTQKWSNSTNNAQLYIHDYSNSTGSSQPHNHGETGSNTNYQPTITVNWIIKAVMLIPDYIIVEDTLSSDSAVDALSARQGKLLNEKFTDYATKSEMIQYLPLSGGTVSGNLKSYYHDFLIASNEFNFVPTEYNNGALYFNYRAGTSDGGNTTAPIQDYYFYNGQKDYASNIYAKHFTSTVNGLLVGNKNLYIISGSNKAIDASGNAPLTEVPSDVYVISIIPTDNVNATFLPYYPGSGFEHWYAHMLTSYGVTPTTLSYKALVYKPN